MKKDNTFEVAYARLEEILEKINHGDISLEKSIELYEEADKLIKNCNEKIDVAEKKITTLMKNREKELVLDEDGNPIQNEFVHNKENILET
ncbi:MAG: Exodeoxyribonuclease 7 small subunit [Chlamydiia bacterium]|nr:Exodeoxyribonuclease 7 small subunit [Chlamydiia bacterium]